MCGRHGTAAGRRATAISPTKTAKSNPHGSLLPQKSMEFQPGSFAHRRQKAQSHQKSTCDIECSGQVSTGVYIASAIFPFYFFEETEKYEIPYSAFWPYEKNAE